MAIRREGEWGQGERGLEGYEDSGSSEITPLPDATPGPTEQPIAGEQPTAGEQSTAGQPGPADAAAAAVEGAPRPVAGRPGPSDEANAALGVPVDGVERGAPEGRD